MKALYEKLNKIYLDGKLINRNIEARVEYSSLNESSSIFPGKIRVQISGDGLDVMFVEALNYDPDNEVLRLWSSLESYYQWLREM